MKKLLLGMFIFLFVLPFAGCIEKVPEKTETHIDSHFTANMGDMNLSGLLIYTDEGEMYLKEFIDVLFNNGYKVWINKINCLDANGEKSIEKFFYEIEIDD